MAVENPTIPFSRKFLKRLERIAARMDTVSELMKVADPPVRRLEAFRLLENVSLEVHNFHRELLNEFQHRRTK
jgi:hypothetical protein